MTSMALSTHESGSYRFFWLGTMIHKDAPPRRPGRRLAWRARRCWLAYQV